MLLRVASCIFVDRYWFFIILLELIKNSLVTVAVVMIQELVFLATGLSVLVHSERFVGIFRSEGPTVSSPVREGGEYASF